MMDPKQWGVFLVDQKGYEVAYLGFLGIYFQVNTCFEQFGAGRSGVIKMLCV